MESVFQELTLGSQHKYAAIRRNVQYFSTFAGGVIEALRESGYRLSNFQRESGPGFHRQLSPGAQNLQQALKATGRELPVSSGGRNIELEFEQRDGDQCCVLIVPFRTDLPYLSKNLFTAQLGLELSRYTSNPEVLRQAMNVNTRGQFGSFLGGRRLPKLYLDSPPALRQPGSMTFELQGARLVVAMNVVVDLGKYRLSDFDLDISAIRGDLQAYFYGLEKYLALLLQNFGVGKVEEEPTSPEPVSTPPAQTVNLGTVRSPADEALTKRLSSLD